MKVFFKDYFKITKPKKKDLKEFKDSFSEPGKGLRVFLEASHAGILNKNARFYIPKVMQNGISSFLSGKPRPILKHHNSDEDPVGKIFSAEFIPTIPEGLLADKDVSFLVDDSHFEKGNLEAVRGFLKNPIVFSKDWKGLGFLKLGAKILDKKTIEQIEDGLFDSVSVGFGANKVFCSVCGTDLAEEVSCEHVSSFGSFVENEETGEKEIACIIPGDMIFKECSLVNFDADPHTAIEIEGISFNDKEELSRTDIPVIKAKWEVFDKEIIDMKKSKKLKDNKVEDSIKEDKEEEVEDKEEGKKKEDKEVDPDVTYKDMEEFLSEDAKLSSEERKNLPDSAFCGPNRSFPVPDCAHVTAARRLIGKYEGPGDKEKIMACVNKKAKAMGCGKEEEKDSKDHEEEEVIKDGNCPEMTLKDMKDEELRSFFHAVELELINRSLTVKRDCSDCAVKQEEIDSLREDSKSFKEREKDLEDTLSILRSELREEFANYRKLVNDSVEVHRKLQEEKEKYASLLKTLSSEDNKVSRLDFDSQEDFDKQYTVLTDAENIEKILKKHKNDGMTNKELEDFDIESPVLKQEEDNGRNKRDAQAQSVLDRVNELIKEDKINAAYALFKKMKSFGILEDEENFEELLKD